MANVVCNMNTLILSVIVILMVAFADTILRDFPILKKLFTDNVNFLLLIVLVVLVLLIDTPSGILLAFLVLYLAVYINYISKKRAHFSDVRPANVNNMSNMNSNPILSDSEFVYNNTAPFPNKNIKPFQPISEEEIIKLSIKSNMPCLPPQVVEVTQKQREGYDVVSCRYDFKDSEQNLSKYGPPLANCSAYSGDQYKRVGTLFYPLNA
jgi:hypothetical protein